MKNKRITAILYAAAAALFYALNVPCSKLLLSNVAPTFMAGFLYIGAGLGVGAMYLFHFKHEASEQRLCRSDLPYTIGMVALDILAPILLMIGIKIGSSANASLLGNFEIAATSVIAFAIFREKISRRLWVALGLVTLSSMILSFGGKGSLEFTAGSLFVLGAAVCWGFENNCTRSISEKSTYQIVTIKGLCSGAGSVIIALVTGEKLPDMRYILPSMLLGYVAYGLSIFTYIRAQQELGAAKTSAYYAIAPFIGAFLSFVLLREALSANYLIALVIMAAGTALAAADTLAHRHTHVHCHTFTHTHDGSTHTHTVTHSHDHCHYVSDSRHGHTHSIAELQRLL